MHEAVVDGCAAGADFAQAALGFGGGAEGVETEGGGVDGVGDADCFVEVGDGEEGHEGAEGFVCEEAVGGGVDEDEGGGDVAVFLVEVAAHEDLAFAVVEHGF